MHALANPARFLRIARPATTWLLLVGLTFAVGGMAAGLILTPPDYLQGETVRISGKDRDTLQDVIAKLKAKDFGIDMSFDNYRTN